MNMHYGATNLIFQKAEELRNRMTPAESVLWNYLRVNDWKIKFRRQHPIAIYVADFYCHSLKLVIELDGGYHEIPEVKINDSIRQQNMEDMGITVIRFKNHEVFENLESIKHTISKTITLILKGNENSDIPSMQKPSLFVVKIGGNVIDNEDNLDVFLTDFAKIQEVYSEASSSLPPFRGRGAILIHGGGKIATKIGDKLGIESKYVDGRRITDDDTIDVVTMVYGGLVNKKIVAALQSKGRNAIGLTGADANIIPAVKRPVKVTPSGERGLDYGWVGDIDTTKINAEFLQLLLENNITPVVAPLTHDSNGHILNTNADTIASSLAVALSKAFDVRLVYCFEKKGVLENVADESSVITLIDKAKYAELKAGNKLFAGILPKLDNAFAAIDAGVKEVLIGDAKDLLQNTTANTVGTLITE
jgi:acetylglutamate kinase